MFIIIFFAVCFVTIAIIAQRKWMNILLMFFVAFGILAMVDFWRWEYNYGHDLDPNAAIKVPGMSYQPPLIGYKQLLNFGAWSVPGIGGWIFVTVGGLLLGAVIYEGRRIKKAIIIPVVLVGFLTGCSTEPLPIRYGQDNCDFCKMTISDHRFGAEIVTKKGKIEGVVQLYSIK